MMCRNRYVSLAWLRTKPFKTSIHLGIGFGSGVQVPFIKTVVKIEARIQVNVCNESSGAEPRVSKILTNVGGTYGV